MEASSPPGTPAGGARLAPLVLPAPDRVLSSRTGYTRETWLAVAGRLLEGVAPWFSASGAQVRLPGRGSWSGADCDGLEGFARTFLLAAFRIAATDGGGQLAEQLVERYARGLVAGAAGEWPRLTPCSQQMVEAAAIAVGLHESRAWLWDKLDGREQQYVVDWLSGFVGSRTWDNNWRLFQVVGEQFLASVGAPYAQDDIDAGLDRVEDWYVGDGWYSDGPGQNFDHYIGWAMHLYPGLWTRMAGPAADGRLAVYRDRLHRFIEDAVHLTGSDGAPIHFGRSLCYRTAAAAPYWMGALLDATPLTPGQTRRLCSGMLRHFVDHGAPDERGLLSLGWHHHFLPTTQPYSGRGSPYWASKGFLGLLLPADHPVWTAPESAIPLDEADQVRAMPAPGILVQATKQDGIVRVLNHGSDHSAEGDAHYNRLAYSTRTGPDHAADAPVVPRRAIRRIAVADHSAASWWEAGDARIEVASVVHGRIEVRCALVAGPAGLIRHGGYAVAGEHLPEATTGPGWAAATRVDRLTSAIVSLYGYERAAVRRDLDVNAFGPHSATPCLEASYEGGDPLVLVAAVVLSGDTVRPAALAEGIDVTVAEHRVHLEFADGTTADVRLGGHKPGGYKPGEDEPGGDEEVGDGGGTAPVAGAPA
ncbi:DUF2264 domain-containing protein [Kribbella solani]|uniref:DUF2264 domain-containing protein n=1 Tax=Kribbella solani TaxID=236067 RepID=UPI0029B92E79|nr:DUF2264 domain-containing protein [Kribbella solani]MDX2973565.1 DUF2264 domain-containing protein [Kribbella solani]